MRTIDCPIDAVSATLEFLSRRPDGPSKPATYMFAPPGGHTWDTASYAPQAVSITNGRGAQQARTLDREGFQLYDAPSAVRDFADREAIERTYYAEMQDLARGLTGASRAIVFDHVLRRRAPGSLSPFGARDGHRPSAALRVHCDFTPASAQRRLALEMAALGVPQVPRFAIINLWRSTRLPVLDAPLAICDARSVREADLVAADIVYPDRTGEIYEVVHHPAQDWTYFHAMQADEVLLFKQYDSRSDVARCTPHAAFNHPATPAGTPPRESIELRCLLMFE